jgi:hypothetical protein
MSAAAALDFEAASGSPGPIATFADGHSNDFRDEALHRQADGWMLTRECCKGARDATNDVTAVSLDMRHRTQPLVHHFACYLRTRPEVPSRPSSWRQFVRESSPSLSKQLLQLICRQPIGKFLHKVRKQRDIGARQELFHIRRELEDV